MAASSAQSAGSASASAAAAAAAVVVGSDRPEPIEGLLAQLVKRLKTRDPGARQQFAKELYVFVATLSRQLSAETYTKLLQQLTPQLYALLQSSHEAEQLGGLAAIDQLIDLSHEDQIIRFANYLRNFLAQPATTRTALLAAARALGHLASAHTTHGVSGTLVAAFVDFEVKRAFEWLQGERPEAVFSQRRLAACFVLRELAQSAPTLFHVNLTTFFQSIWGAIRDVRVEIREAATDALRACLELIARRQTRHRVQWYCKVYDQVFEGLHLPTRSSSSSSSGAGGGSGSSSLTASMTASHSGALASRSGSSSSLTAMGANGSLSSTSVHPSPSATTVAPPTAASWDSVHGSLLVIGELLHNTGGFMVPRFREVCDTVLLYKDAKDRLVSRTVCGLLPQLAAFCPDAFLRYYLHVALNHLMKRVVTHTAPGERGIAFLALGQLALAIGEHILPHLPPIIKLVKESLAQVTTKGKRRSKNKLYCVETLTCVAHLSRALGTRFEPYLMELLEIMMQGGLSEELLEALGAIVESVPSCLPVVHERLLNEISSSLRGVPFAAVPGELGGIGSGGGGGGSGSGAAGEGPGDGVGGYYGYGIEKGTLSDVSPHAATAASAMAAGAPMPPPPSSSSSSSSKSTGVVQAIISSMRFSVGGSQASSSSTTSSPALGPADSSSGGGGGGGGPLGVSSPGGSAFGDDDKSSSGFWSASASPSLGPAVVTYPVLKGENPEEVETILLALRALSCFDFSGSFCLLPFVRDCVALYWRNPDPRIRKQAVITSTQLLLPSSAAATSTTAAMLALYASTTASEVRLRQQQQQLQQRRAAAASSCWRHVTKRGPSGRVIDELVWRLLQVGISDPDVHVRKSVVDSLDPRFDELLSQSSHVAALFTLLNDEVAEIRERAMRVLERLAPRNPALVTPSLRRVLIQLLTELEHTTEPRMQEDATRLLGLLIRGAQQLIDPYIVRILHVLLPKLVVGNASLASSVLVTIGELAVVAQHALSAYERYLFPLILHTLQDHSSIEKRQLALRTLGQLAGSTACVVRPYLAFPKLLEILLSLLQHNAATPWPLRREAMKTIGILGALDPYKYKLCVSRASLLEANDAVSSSSTGASTGGGEQAQQQQQSQQQSQQQTRLGPAPPLRPGRTAGILDLDLAALGVRMDLTSMDRAQALMGVDVLDEKQQIELQLFTAAPIGTRRAEPPGKSAAPGGGAPGSSSLASDGSTAAGGGGAGGGGGPLGSSSVPGVGPAADDWSDFERLLPDDHELVLDPTSLSPAADAYFPTVAISALLKILKEPSLSAHHHGVIQAIMFIFKSLQIQCVPFLPYILPPFLRVLARGEPRLRESLFLQLTTLIGIVQGHLKPFFPAIMALALRFWGFHLPQIIRLIERMSQATPGAFRTQYFPKLLPKLLDVLQPHAHPELFFELLAASSGVNASGGRSKLASAHGGAHKDVGGILGGPGGVGVGKDATLVLLSAADASTAGSRLHLVGGASGVVTSSGGMGGGVSGAGGDRGDGVGLGVVVGGTSQGKLKGKPAAAAAAVAALQIQVVQALVVFRDAVEDYVYLVVPALSRLMESLETPLEVKVATIYAIARICMVATFEHYAGARLLQPLARVARQVSTKSSLFFRSSGSSSSSSAGPGAVTMATSTAMHGGAGGGGAGTYLLVGLGGDSSGGSGVTAAAAAAAASGAASIAASKSEAKTFTEVVLYALAALLYQLQVEFLRFEPLVHQIVVSLPMQSTESSTQDLLSAIRQAMDRLRHGERVDRAWLMEHPAFAQNASLRAIAMDLPASAAVNAGSAVASASTPPSPPPPSSSTSTRLHVNQQNLRRAWEASQRSTKEDWLEWMRRFSIELLRESPSAALRSCCALAQAYNPLARELFNPAFVSCWNELYEQYQDYLVRALETAFQSETIPGEILQTLLNLAEFMEHDVEALPIDIRELGELAQKCHAYAKALHYKELEFHTSPSTCIEALISINNQLGQPEAAVGILKYAQEHHRDVIHVQETWYEKLQDWNAALGLYEAKIAALHQAGERVDLRIWLGKMRCLEALGEWEALAALAAEVFADLNARKQHQQQQAALNQQTASARRLASQLQRQNSAGSVSSSSAAGSLSRHGSFATPGASGGLGSASGVGSGGGFHSSANPYDDGGGEAASRRIAMLGAKASWCLSQWDQMATYVDLACGKNPSAAATTAGANAAAVIAPHALASSSSLSATSASLSAETATDSALFRAVLAVHHNHFDEATRLIDETRRHLDTRLGALVGESYPRAYKSMVTLQQLSELEEILTYKHLRLQVAKTEDAARYKRHLVRMWHARLQTGCKRVVDVWQPILAVRSLILAPHEDIDTWLQFASLCRQSGNLSMSLKVFTKALAVNTSVGVNGAHPSGLPGLVSANGFGYGEREHHRVAFAYLKHLWGVNEKRKALHELQSLVSTISAASSVLRSRMQGSGGGPMGSASQSLPPSVPPSFGNSSGSGSGGEEELLVKCHLKLAEWQLAIHDQQLDRVSIPGILGSLQLCTELESKSYKAWHAWALMNFHVVEHFTAQQQQQGAMNAAATNHAIGPYIAPAIEGFFRSIALGRSRWAANVQQDILRVLTLWFAYGHRADVHQTLVQGFQSVNIETWLIVIPQLIARIHTPSPRIQTQLHRLLCAIGAQHPHALIYPLSVALKSPLPVRHQAAEAIMNTMRRHYVELVDEALLVSRELIRVAILWHEMWHEGLEEASRLYFGEHDVEGMVAVLEPLHQMMESGPETLREVSFQQAFGRDLREAYEWLQRFLHSGNRESDLNRAWDLYYHVFRRINKQLPQLTTLELQYVSPNLLQARDLQLAVPGTYRAGHSVVKIGRFLPTIPVITSKQRPRRITIVGSNGLEYMFLLKGHEDLRQDERVTQLFGLVNALLINDRTTSKKDLQIHRYPVIPLSHNAGIIGWVPHCDTLHQLIRDYREARKILLNIEHRLMLQMAPDYDALGLLQKVEVFQYALENTAGQDLYKVLWLKSENSEIWLDRRTTYTRSLAVMSMVGYILGLGDRHPSNLMLHRFTGTIVHIDYGDCFEVAMHRDKYPERIPFRLTRMLTNAMEVSGIEGNFKFSCESVMAVLRENRHSLMAMLEAFVHDPLICWRLLAPTQQPREGNGPGTGGPSPTRATPSAPVAVPQAPVPVPAAPQPTARPAPAPAPAPARAPAAPAPAPAPAATAPATVDPTPASSTTATAAREPAAPPAANAPTAASPGGRGRKEEPRTPASIAEEEADEGDEGATANDSEAADTAAVDDNEREESDSDDQTDNDEEEDDAAESDNDEDDDDDDDDDDEDDEDDVAESLSASAVLVSRMPRRPPPGRSGGGIVSTSVQRSRPGAMAMSLRQPPSRMGLPPRPSTSVSSARPMAMSLSSSIAFTRTLPPRVAAGAGDDEHEDPGPVERIDHRTTNLHAEISSLAASVTDVGQGSLRRKFSQTAAEARATATSGETTTMTATDAAAQTPGAAAPTTATAATKPRRPSFSVQLQQQEQAAAAAAAAAANTPAPPATITTTSSTVDPSHATTTNAAPATGAATHSTTTTATTTTATTTSQSQSTAAEIHANRSHRERELVHALGPEGAAAPREALNEKAVAVIRRVQAKLTGRDFEGEREPLDPRAQVQRLIEQATSHENLCQCYIGWCPFW